MLGSNWIIQSYFFNLKSEKSLVLNYSDCVQYCDSKSMILPHVNDAKRIQEDFEFVLKGSGRTSKKYAKPKLMLASILVVINH